MNWKSFPDAVRTRIESAIELHTHPYDVEVIEHPNYGPFVKLVCGECNREQYVSTKPEAESPDGE